MDNLSVVTVHVVDDEGAPQPTTARAALVTPLLVLVAADPAERILAARGLGVTVTAADGTVERPTVRSVDVRPRDASGTALVGLTLDEPVRATPDVVAGLGDVGHDDAAALADVAWRHLRSGDEVAGGGREPDPDDPAPGTASAADGSGLPLDPDPHPDDPHPDEPDPDEPDPDEPDLPWVPGTDDDPLGLFCRLFGMGCPRVVLD